MYVMTGELYDRYVFLEKVLSRDFVFRPRHTGSVSQLVFISHIK